MDALGEGFPGALRAGLSGALRANA